MFLREKSNSQEKENSCVTVSGEKSKQSREKGQEGLRWKSRD